MGGPRWEVGGPKWEVRGVAVVKLSMFMLCDRPSYFFAWVGGPRREVRGGRSEAGGPRWGSEVWPL